MSRLKRVYPKKHAILISGLQLTKATELSQMPSFITQSISVLLASPSPPLWEGNDCTVVKAARDCSHSTPPSPHSFFSWGWFSTPLVFLMLPRPHKEAVGYSFGLKETVRLRPACLLCCFISFSLHRAEFCIGCLVPTGSEHSNWSELIEKEPFLGTPFRLKDKNSWLWIFCMYYSILFFHLSPSQKIPGCTLKYIRKILQVIKVDI